MNTDIMCKCCHLYKKRKNIVWYRGTSTKDIDVLFVGDAPSKEDDFQGIPFSGLSGEILDEWIKNAEIANYAIINLVKCRTPKDRPPSRFEIRTCLPFFITQICELNPKIIASLGKTSYVTLVDIKIGLRDIMLTKDIGEIFQSIYGKVIVFPHPLAVSRRKEIYVPITKLRDIVNRL